MRISRKIEYLVQFVQSRTTRTLTGPGASHLRLTRRSAVIPSIEDVHNHFDSVEQPVLESEDKCRVSTFLFHNSSEIQPPSKCPFLSFPGTVHPNFPLHLMHSTFYLLTSSVYFPISSASPSHLARLILLHSSTIIAFSYQVLAAYSNTVDLDCFFRRKYFQKKGILGAAIHEPYRA